MKKCRTCGITSENFYVGFADCKTCTCEKKKVPNPSTEEELDEMARKYNLKNKFWFEADYMTTEELCWN